MTNQQILEEAIQKAIDGGWKPDFLAEPVVAGLSLEDYKMRIRFGSISNSETLAVQELIFNHDFAKALWGGKGYAERWFASIRVIDPESRVVETIVGPQYEYDKIAHGVGDNIRKVVDGLQDVFNTQWEHYDR